MLGIALLVLLRLVTGSFVLTKNKGKVREGGRGGVGGGGGSRGMGVTT